MWILLSKTTGKDLGRGFLTILKLLLWLFTGSKCARRAVFPQHELWLADALTSHRVLWELEKYVPGMSHCVGRE